MRFIIIKIRKKQHVTIAGLRRQLTYFEYVFILITCMSKKKKLCLYFGPPNSKFWIRHWVGPTTIGIQTHHLDDLRNPSLPEENCTGRPYGSFILADHL